MEEEQVAETKDCYPPHVLMGFIADKLGLVHCYEEFCQPKELPYIHRLQFAFVDKNPSMQFQLFIDLSAWLVTKITDDATFLRVDKFDDPNTAVNKLLMALRRLDFALDFPSSKLKQAHGDAACSVLDFLTEKAVAKCFVFKPPEYPQEEDVEAEADDDADIGDIDDDVLPDEDDDAMFFDAPEEEDPAYEESHQILKSQVDPAVWQTEVERVAPRLRAANRSVANGSDWRAHIEKAKEHSAKINELAPTALKAVADRLNDAKDKIALKENYINKHFEDKKDALKALKDDLKDAEALFQKKTDNVAKLTKDLAAIAEQLDDMKGTMTDRGNSMTDTTPVVAIKQALKQLKQEVVDFDLQIGVVSHTLMRQQLRDATAHTEPNNAPAENKTYDDDDDDLDSLS